MRNLLKLEYCALFILSIVLFAQTEYSWWIYLVLFFVPDIGMIGYLFNTRIGAFTYNILHHLGSAVIMIVLGVLLTSPICMLAGIILLGHSAFDRLVGYGLKYPDSFTHTHLSNL